MDKRLQILRETLRLQWGELAQRMRISRSMLDQVRAGKRALSYKAIRRLEQVEIEAGVLSMPLKTESPPLTLHVHEPPAETPTKKKKFVALRERMDRMETDIQDMRTIINELEHEP